MHDHCISPARKKCICCPGILTPGADVIRMPCILVLVLPSCALSSALTGDVIIHACIHISSHVQNEYIPFHVRAEQKSKLMHVNKMFLRSVFHKLDACYYLNKISIITEYLAKYIVSNSQPQGYIFIIYSFSEVTYFYKYYDNFVYKNVI